MHIRKSIFGVNYSIVNYTTASELIVEKAAAKQSFGVSALAVHGLIESVKDNKFKKDLDKFDMIVPDGQPIRWALNSFYKVELKDKVAGPILTLRVLEKANEKGLGVYLYGSTQMTLNKLISFINFNYPNIIISGKHADRFREATEEEDLEDIYKINESNTNLVLVGRGCPRQEKWVANHIGKINAPMMAVGAAFDFMAGNIKHAPLWMQKNGLEWFHRLVQDPKRLWKRYLLTNTHFIFLFFISKLGLKKFNN